MGKLNELTAFLNKKDGFYGLLIGQNAI